MRQSSSSARQSSDFLPDIFEALPFFTVTTIPVTKRFHLHGILVSAGHEIARTKQYRFKGLYRGKRPFAVIQLTLRGQGILEYEKKKHVLLPGTIMLAQVPHDHEYYLDQDSGGVWEFVYFCVAGNELLRLHDDVERTEGPVLSCRNYPFLERYFRDLLFKLSQSPIPDEFHLSGAMYSLYMQLIAQRYQMGKLSMTAKRRLHVQAAEDWCKLNFAKPFTIEQLSETIGIDRSYLSREFKAVHGITLQDYIEKIRLEKCLVLLGTSRETIQAIASKSGYADVNYFCRVFRKRIGMSPGEYRTSLFHAHVK